jgi:hypothetical protein
VRADASGRFVSKSGKEDQKKKKPASGAGFSLNAVAAGSP